jgi:cell division protein FtsQ
VGTRPAPLRRGRRVLRWTLAGVLLGALFGGALWGGAWLLVPDNVPLHRVRVDGEVRHTRREALERALASRLDGSFFGLDLDAVRRGVELLPWVQRASVRRVWPGTLVVHIQERRALARWGKRALVSPAGEVFEPEADSMPAGLAYLEGPHDSAATVAERYRWMRAYLAPYGLEITRLALSERHAWTLELGDGERLLLGNRGLERRLQRYLTFLQKLREQGQPERVDLRYSNGFAVSWRQPVTGATETGAEG